MHRERKWLAHGAWHGFDRNETGILAMDITEFHILMEAFVVYIDVIVLAVVQEDIQEGLGTGRGGAR